MVWGASGDPSSLTPTTELPAGCPLRIAVSPSGKGVGRAHPEETCCRWRGTQGRRLLGKGGCFVLRRPPPFWCRPFDWAGEGMPQMARQTSVKPALCTSHPPDCPRGLKRFLTQ